MDEHTVLRSRGVSAVRNKLNRLFQHHHWTDEQVTALEEWIRLEEAAAGEESLSCGELARRAMRQLVPAVLGDRSEYAVVGKIRKMRRILTTRRSGEAEDSKSEGSSAGPPAHASEYPSPTTFPIQLPDIDTSISKSVGLGILARRAEADMICPDWQ